MISSSFVLLFAYAMYSIMQTLEDRLNMTRIYLWLCHMKNIADVNKKNNCNCINLWFNVTLIVNLLQLYYVFRDEVLYIPDLQFPGGEGCLVGLMEWRPSCGGLRRIQRILLWTQDALDYLKKIGNIYLSFTEMGWHLKALSMEEKELFIQLIQW